MVVPDCWGGQIGGIQATSHVDQAIERSLEGISSDHHQRIEDFMRRHGGPAAPITYGRLDGGYRGWAELDAADGFVLRIEWSRDELRATMNIMELPPVALPR
jgi:hypothetical protein